MEDNCYIGCVNCLYILTSKRNASVTFGTPDCINSRLFLFKEFTMSYSDIIPNKNENFSHFRLIREKL